jgi:pimeloyl-ACP methyl ester carboxylesterase
MSVVLLNNKVVHYEAIGRGRPVFFLHSWVGSWRYWVPVMQAASTSYRAYVIDFWGFGETARDPEKYSLEQQADLINLFLEQMGIGRVVLVGHGVGAIISWVFANRFSDIVDRLMLVGFPFNIDTLNRRLAASNVPEMVDWVVGKEPSMEPVRRDAARNDLLAIQTSIKNIETLNLWEAVKTMSIPCLQVHGLNDPLVQPPTPEQINNLPEKSHAVLFEESGHFPMLSESNRFNRLMMDFLSLKSGESIRQLQLKDEWKRRVR